MNSGDLAYQERILTHLRNLGIAEDYGDQRGLTLQSETADLVTVRIMKDGRQIQLTPTVAQCWAAMVESAAKDSITLLLLSGFRSVEYQRQILEKKLGRGDQLEHILKINAAPGYSEHHTGRAVDIGTPGCPPLEEDFEKTDAFRWLQEKAHHFGFYLSYPRGNRHGILYEPWHWMHRVIDLRNDDDNRQA